MHPSPSISYLASVVPIGSTNGVLPNTTSYSRDYSDWKSSEIDYTHTHAIEIGGRRYFNDRRVRRSYRQDTISNINWGMTVIANGIKVISAILTILGTDDTDR